jgi:hypothetical protein
MKKLIFGIFSVSMILFSCKSSKLTHFSDDVYSDPVEERRIALAKAEALKKQQAEEKEKAEAERLAQKAIDDANPYYQDPQYNADDYYDYAYASRMRRFQNPVYGAGYYDNYYTNSYWYNQNPYSYGTSIYGGYNWWNPYGTTGIYMGNSWGNPMCYNNGFNYGLGYSYGSYWNNPYYGYGQPFGMCNNYWNSPWNNPYYGYGNYGNWGYYNSYDVNSNYTYAPRQGNTGSNSARGSYAGMAMPKDLSGDRIQFMNSMIEKQESTPKFTNIERRTNPTFNEPSVNGGALDQNSNTGRNNGTKNTTYSGNDGKSVGTGRNTYNTNTNGNTNETQTGTISNPRKNQSAGTKISDSNNKAQDSKDTYFNRSSGGGNSGGGGGGTSSPRGGGSTNKPR